MKIQEPPSTLTLRFETLLISISPYSLSFTSQFTMSKAHEGETFPKCRAALNYCLILHPLISRLSHPVALLYTKQSMDTVELICIIPNLKYVYYTYRVHTEVRTELSCWLGIGLAERTWDVSLQRSTRHRWTGSRVSGAVRCCNGMCASASGSAVADGSQPK